MAPKRRQLTESEYAALVARAGAAMRDYMDGKARQLGIEPEDALEHALVDIWVEAREQGWLEDRAESRRFIFRQLRDAAIDAVRAGPGRANDWVLRREGRRRPHRHRHSAAAAASPASMSGNEWCSWATTHRPSSLRSPSPSRKRLSGWSASSCRVPQRSSAWA